MNGLGGCLESAFRTHDPVDTDPRKKEGGIPAGDRDSPHALGREPGGVKGKGNQTLYPSRRLPSSCLALGTAVPKGALR